MNRKLKWTVLAVAISAAAAASAEDNVTNNIENNITNNWTSTVDNTWTSTVDKSWTSSVDSSVVQSYNDSFNRSTDISATDEFNRSTNIAMNDEFNRSTNINDNFTRDYTDTKDYSETFDWTLVLSKTFITHQEDVDIDRDIDSHEMNVSLRKSLSLSSDIAFTGDPTVTGNIDLDSAAIAVIDNRQTVTENWGFNEQLDNDASIADDTASAASGNLQCNVAAGDNNVQDNAAALSAADASFSFGLADAEVFVNQTGAHNMTSNLGVANTASISDNAFSDAAGNIGVNVTSGNNNTQKNALAASVATSAYAQASVSSNQVSTMNTVKNAPLERQYYDTVRISLSGNVSGRTAAVGVGGYAGSTSGEYEGSGAAYQMDNFYLDSWSGGLDHPSGNSTGHLDMDADIQNAVMNPNRQGVGGIAFDTEESGSYSGSEEGKLGFLELGYADLDASLSGYLQIARYEVVADATNSATLSGSAFARAAGNIGVNVSAGTGNLQANSLAMAVAQPSTGGGGGGGGGGE